MGLFDLFSRKKEKKETLDKGLEKTQRGLFDRISHAIAGKSTVDDDVLDNLEEVFVTSDVGVDTTLRIIDRLQARVAKDKYVGASELNRLLCEEISEMLAENGETSSLDDFTLPEGNRPHVIMVVGVNGVVLGAADTFRAAAIEQLEEWGRRADVPVVKQKLGADPASVAFDTLQSAIANNADVVIIDTAGRLHNKKGLMDELTKVRNVMQKLIPDAPHEVLLVLDGSTGQNAFEQARQFVAATQVNELAITKLDGTAKGGVVIGISDQFKIPVKYIGLGEKINDLQVFDKRAFVESLFGEKK